ncbi:MAG: membrane protein insertion efficiency factor YidD [Elusimicrobia bacterium]|nr:membrane protein insertion efficiency factor YidD [Elusimicrobiota bacterium]
MASTILRFYRGVVSPLFSLLTLQSSCVFVPSCSHYMEETIQGLGWRRGFVLGFKRFLRCHPWSPGGYDPAPNAQK